MIENVNRFLKLTCQTLEEEKKEVFSLQIVMMKKKNPCSAVLLYVNISYKNKYDTL
jgi:hypothetical protein